MMRFSEVRKRDVVTTDTAETIGRIDALIVDPSSRSVGAVRLAKVDRDAAGDHVSWSDLQAFGQDVVTVATAAVLRAPDGPREADFKKVGAIVGKQVLDDAGFGLGDVDEVEFDPATGAVTTIITKAHQIAGERLLGIGTFAVVVTHSEA